MLLTLSTTHPPATDLGYLLHKHPARFQTFDLSFGKAHLFYPEASAERCTACLLLDVDPIGMVRRRTPQQSLLSQYVNDRPYVASSLLSVAIAQVLGSALQGKCQDRPDLAAAPIPLPGPPGSAARARRRECSVLFAFGCHSRYLPRLPQGARRFSSVIGREHPCPCRTIRFTTSMITPVQPQR
jgi:hypothetical protein